MKLDFPKEEIPDYLVKPHYEMVTDMHMHYEKMRVQQDFTYMKYAGFFAFALLGSMILEGKGVFSDYYTAVAIIGFSVLYVSVISMIFIGSDIDQKLAYYAEKGWELEEKYPSIVNFNYFRALKAVKVNLYRGTLFFRLFPLAFVGIFTIWAGATLSMKINPNFATLVGVLLSIILMSMMGFLARSIKKCQLKGTN